MTGSVATSSSPPTTIGSSASTSPTSGSQKLDKDLIPNISNLVDAQAHPPFDPNREYSLPWLSGMDGIAWNEDLTGPVTTVTQLFEDPKLKGKVTVWNSMGDTLGLVLLENGDDPAKVTDEAFDRAIAKVQAAVDSGQIRRFTGNDYAQPLANGDLAACMAWSGDVASLVATIRSSTGRSRRRAGSSGRTTCSSRSAAACRPRRRT